MLPPAAFTFPLVMKDFSGFGSFCNSVSRARGYNTDTEEHLALLGRIVSVCRLANLWYVGLLVLGMQFVTAFAFLCLFSPVSDILQGCRCRNGVTSAHLVNLYLNSFATLVWYRYPSF